VVVGTAGRARFRLRAEDDYALPGNTNDALTKSETHAAYKPAVK
jgi:hypothetical protein